MRHLLERLVDLHGEFAGRSQNHGADARGRILGDLEAALLESGVGTSFTTWGLDDPDSWLLRPQWVSAFGPAEAPLLFDGDYQPKPAYFALLDVLDKRTSIT